MQQHHSTTEEWRPVVGWEGIYDISDLGRVRSHHGGKATVLMCATTRKGYKRVRLHNKARRRHAMVHRLVLEAFAGPCPNGHVCAHDDGNPSNNCFDNLRWATPLENAADTLMHGTRQRGEDASGCKATESDVEKILEMRNQRVPRREVAEAFGISVQQVTAITNGYGRHFCGGIGQRLQRGEQHNQAKLTEIDVKSIRSRRARGESLKGLAAEFNVSESSISNIALMKSWRHI